MTTLIPAWIGGTLRPADKLEVHRQGWPHLAVSVFVNCGEETLLQRRAEGKYHTPGLWSNACCTHPMWGERAEDCAARRLREELGIACSGLVHCGQARYRAEVGGGLVENEVVEIFALDLADRPDPRPDPEEVADTRWMSYASLRARIGSRPQDFTPWLAIYLSDYSALLEKA
jgi:isopentenyl-diphosphate Delta-isomerase